MRPRALFAAAAPAVRIPLRLGGFVAWTAALLSVAELHQLLVDDSRRGIVFDGYRRRWCRGWLGLIGAEVRVVRPPPPPRHGRVVVANHRAFFDIPLLLAHLGGAFLSRADLADWPLFGRAARKAGTIFVDRRERQSGRAAIAAMRARLQAGATVLVFPEGTTFAGDAVRPLRPGGFVAAQGLAVEILPAGIAYAPGAEMGSDSTLAHVRKSAGRARTEVAVSYGEPFSTGDDVAAMIERSHRELTELIAASRRALG